MAHPLRDDDPTHIGCYRLHARLGGGGMGQVFLGRSPGGHTVAVKVVRPELADDADFRRRFASEVAAARRVGGFYTAPVVDADPDATPPWLATAYILGPSLHTAVADHGPLPAESVAVLGAGLAEGLTAVHAQQVVHRDLKPANVILAQDGPRLIDFGIARALDATSHTQTSTVMGTAAFMSPEQARADKVGPASDVFSLGCVLAFAATGRSPFGDGPGLAVMYRVVQEDADLSGLPAVLAGLVGACLAKDPTSRPGLEEVLAALATSAPSDRTRVDGRWPSEDLTEFITRHGARTPTLVETERTSDFDGRSRETGPTEDVGDRPGRGSHHRKDQVSLAIANLGPSSMDVIVDDSAVGSVRAGGVHTFTIAPGRHALSVEVSNDRRSAPWHFEAKAGSTVKQAFDASNDKGGGPRRVREVAFTAARGADGGAGILGWAGALAVLAFVGGLIEGQEEPLMMALGGLILGGIVGVLMAFTATPVRLVLNYDGMKPPLETMKTGTISWDDIERVGVTGDGRATLVRARYRDGASLPSGVEAGATNEYAAKGVGVSEEKDLARLRLALRWFAGSAYAEQWS